MSFFSPFRPSKQTMHALSCAQDVDAVADAAYAPAKAYAADPVSLAIRFLCKPESFGYRVTNKNTEPQ